MIRRLNQNPDHVGFIFLEYIVRSFGVVFPFIILPFIKIMANNFATPAARNPKMKSVCNRVPVIRYRVRNGCNGFVIDTVKIDFYIPEDAMISTFSVLQSDHKDR